MNRTRLLMIGVLALALGFFASVYVYKSLQSKSSSGIENGVDVIVAANDLQVGARVMSTTSRLSRSKALICLPVRPEGGPMSSVTG